MNRQVAILSRVFAEKLTCATRASASVRPSAVLARSLSTKNDKNANDNANGNDKFRPSRRTPKALQSTVAPKPKVRSKKEKPPIHLHHKHDSLGPDATSALEYLSRFGDQAPDHESTLRAADYLTSDVGTTEDLVGNRRALMDALTPQEAQEYQASVDALIQHQADHNWDDLPWNETDTVANANANANANPQDKFNSSSDQDSEDPLQKAFGPWSETIVRVDRVQKVQRGGTMVRYRALVIAGNLNGCAGFGVAKANAPNEASAAAARVARRNIFFIDRYHGTGLTSDLVGRQNSCRVSLRSVNPNRGLHGHPLICEILKYFGITDCTAKSHGNRNVYNVVRATFKAIMTHESLEDIAMKRGKRLMNLERAKRLKI